MHYFALDIGTRRTGIAFADDEGRVPVALETIKHASFDALEEQLLSLIKERAIDHIILGLPLLLSGAEGEQVVVVRDFARRLSKRDIPLSFIDERYTTPRTAEIDGDSAAACQILQTFLDIKTIDK